MQFSRKLSAISGILFLGIMLLAPVSAQVPVVEAGASQNNSQRSNNNSSSSANTANNEILVNMYLQLEALQTEVQNLRGLVEEQSYQIRRMQTQQRDRYLDVDSRLSAMNADVQEIKNNPTIVQQAINPGDSTGLNNRPAAVPPTLVPPVVPADEPGTGIASDGISVAAGEPQNDQDLYRQALNLLLEQEAFEESVALFQQYLDVYPDGRYLTNSLYWQGAALVLMERYGQAIEVLQRLIDEFPQDPKAPTAMLRLGTAYNEMGNSELAVLTWQNIAELYPDSPTEIRFANEFLAELGN